MKKILFLLLSTIAMYGQVPADATPLENIQVTNNTADDTATKVVVQSANNVLNWRNAFDLPTPTASTNALELKTTVSAGAFSGFAVTDNGNGTINVASGIAYLRATNDQYAPIIKYPLAAYNNIPLVDGITNYVTVSYNGGSPSLLLNTTGTGIDTQTNSIAIVAARVGTTVHYISLVGSNSDPNAKIRTRYLFTESIKRETGLVISTPASLKIATTAGITYSGLIRLDVPMFNTNTTDTFTQAYQNGGGTWVRTTGLTSINNTQYNNGGTLATLGTNKYRADFVYTLVNSPSKLYVLLGAVEYNSLSLAQAAPRPAVVPVELQQLGVLVGRVIVKKDDTVLNVASPFAVEFAASVIPDHNDLAGLNTGDFQHLTVAEKAALETTVNKSDSFTVSSSTTYASTKALVDGLAPKITNNVATDITVNGLTVGRGGGNISANTAVGIEVLQNNTAGNNTAIGYRALKSNVNGSSNFAGGSNALTSNVSGGNNTAIGFSALSSSTTASGNLSLGSRSLSGLLSGNNNIATGINAGRYISGGTVENTISANSIFFGADSTPLGDNQINQIVIGFGGAGLGSNTTSIGNSSTQFGRWWGNLLLGTSTNNGRRLQVVGGADIDNLNITTTPTTASGTPPILVRNATTGAVESVPYSTFGTSNAVLLTGDQTISGTKTFSTDVKVYGITVGRGNGQISTNTALGGGSVLLSNTSGNTNTAIGSAVLLSNTSGNSNTSVGAASLFNNTSGSSNTTIGYNSGRYVADGSSANSISNNSLFIGSDTKALADNQTNQIVIGHNAIGAGSNTATLGNTSITKTVLRGTVEAGNGTALNHLITKAQTLYNNLSKSANYTVLLADFANNNELIISVDATAGAVTITLPAFATLRGYKVIVKKMDSSANSVLIQGVSGINIDGNSTLVVSGQYSKSTIGADASQYIIL